MMIKAKEKPIIFSTGLIPAIQNLKPNTWPPEPIDPGKPWKYMTRRVIKPQPQRFFEVNEEPLYLYDVEWNLGSIYPKYQPGDILWVRETWGVPISLAGDIIYKADFVDRKAPLADGEKWRPSIFMPKEAARLWLEVKNVRVERLQNITADDIRAEGTPDTPHDSNCLIAERQSFIDFWDSINAKRGYPWKNNDWVWVYEFMRIE